MRKCLIVCLVFVLFLLLSCDSVSPDEQEDFSIDINLSNSNDSPLAGYKVTIFQKNFFQYFGTGGGRAQTARTEGK